MKTYHSNKWTQDQLIVLSNDIVDNFDTVAETLGISLKKTNRMYVGVCPVHNGDNSEALNLYRSGAKTWICNTHHCEKVFCNTAIGFIRGILSHINKGWEHQGNEMVSFYDAVEWCLAFIKKDYSDVESDIDAVEQYRFTSRFANTKPISYVSGPSRECVLNSGLQIPSPYYLNKKPPYLASTLKKFDVGLCLDPSKPFYNRSVVPVYDNNHRHMIGCTGRSIFDKCNKCNFYHRPGAECREIVKWRHSDAFQAENILYNYWYAKDFIKQTKTVVVVESPGNVWRLDEAGVYNTVATFGTALKDGQKKLLDKSGAMSILVIGDNDRGGDILIADIKDKCENLYNILSYKPTLADVGDCCVQQVKDEILPLLTKLNLYG